MVRKLEAARSGGFIGLSQGMRQLPNRAEMNSAIVRRHARVVPVGTVNGKLNGGVPMPEPLSTYRQATSASDEMLPHSERLAG
jgi:hypothetical protein